MNAQHAAIIEEMNFAQDRRNCSRDEAPILYVELADGSIEEVRLPTKWEVCDVCNGEGSHVNPSIDCGGLSSEDFEDDPDFAEDYRRGTYDVQCNKCGGRTTVHAVDWDRLTPKQRSAYEAQLRDEADSRAEHLAEVRMGA